MTKRVPRSEIVANAAEVVNLPKKTVDLVLTALLDEICFAVLRGGDMVILTGFGTFERRDKPERMGTNPQTHEPIIVPAARSLVFKASKANRGAA